jgi:hypothetical protein
MNEPTAIPQNLSILRQRLDAVDGVRAQFASESEVTVEFNGRPIGNWVPDGKSLTGAFLCEAALLCADSEDEAYRLTMGRLA